MSEKDKTFAARLNAGLREALDEFKKFYEENNNEILTTDKSILEALLDVATAKYKPYKDNSDKIKELEKRIKELETQNQTITEKAKKLQEQNYELEQELKKLQNELGNKEKTVSDLILRWSDFPKAIKKLIKLYLSNEKTKRMFARANKEGYYNGFFDKIDTGEKQKDIANLLKGTFLFSAMGKSLPPVTKNAKIKEWIEDELKGL